MTDTQSIVWIIEGYEGAPFMIARHCTPLIGCVHYVPERLDYKRLGSLVAAGFAIDDPHNLITCHCGAFKHWRRNECDVCAGEYADVVDDRQTQYDLSIGG